MKICEVKTKEEFLQIETLAEEIWREHFTPIIGKEQVSYMLNKFLTHTVMENAVKQDAYAFYQMKDEEDVFGFISVHPEKEMMFLRRFLLPQSRCISPCKCRYNLLLKAL